MKLAHRSVLFALAFSLAALASVPPASAQETSRARIVRLSYVEGTVTVARPNSTDWSDAPVNTPIQEGFRLSTAAGSFAEVEFENGSTARLGEQSLVDFTQLGLTESGDAINRLTLEQGYATFHVFPAHADVYEVKAGEVTLRAGEKSEFRADLDSGRLRVEVFKGDVAYTSAQGSGTVSRNKALEISPGAQEATLSHGITRDDWDDWVAGRDQEQEADSQRPGPDRSAPAYGWSDLDQYGVWSDYPGYGFGWAPSVASLGPWSPFTYGQWVWYPSFGYTWIGYEPWGWLPYHYGSWFFDSFAGWFWIPGAFNYWNPAPVNWYVGGGLVGWCPMTPTASNALTGTTPAAGSGARGGAAKSCTPGAPGCLVAVPIKNLAKGTPVEPGQLAALDPAEATKVAKPDVPPTTFALLPGTPATEPALIARLRSGAPLGSAAPPGASAAASHAAPSRSREAREGLDGFAASRGTSPGAWHARRAPVSPPPASAESRAESGDGPAHSARFWGSWGAESRTASGTARSMAGGMESSASAGAASHAGSASGGSSHSSAPHH